MFTNRKDKIKRIARSLGFSGPVEHSFNPYEFPSDAWLVLQQIIDVERHINCISMRRDGNVIIDMRSFDCECEDLKTAICETYLTIIGED